MARQILPIAGAIVGGIIGGPMGAQIGFALGSAIGNAVDPLEVQGNKIGDNPMQAAAEGGARAIVFGKGCIRATCILERGNRIIRKQRDQAGKGGGPVTVNERVYWTFAIGLGEDLIGGAILRIWEGEKLVYDVTPGSQIPEETAEFAEKFRFYDGSEDQLPDPDLETIHGVGEAPYYRGTAYVVFPNFDLTDYRESIPPYRWEVAKAVGVASGGHAMAYGSVGPGQFRWAFSPDGEDWSAPLLPADGTFNGPNALRSGDRYISWNSSEASYTDDFGQSFENSLPPGSMGGSGGIRGGASKANIVLIAGGINEIRRSVNSGQTFEAISSPDVNHIAIGDSMAVAVPSSAFSSSWKGGTDGTSFVAGEAHGVDLLNSPNAIATDGTNFRIAGAPSAGSAVRTTSNPLAGWFDVPITLSPGSYATCIASGRVGSDVIWVVGCSNGDIFCGVNGDGFVLANDSLGIIATDVTFNGRIFIMTGGEEGGAGSGAVIKTSTNGMDWVERSNLFTTGIRAVASLAEASPSVIGEPIPLSSIVAAIHERCGHESYDYNVTALTDLLAGVVFEQSTTGAESINSLIGSYMADPSEYDGQVNYIKRGASVVRTIAYDDLVDEPDTTQRQNPIEYPRKLHYFFQSSITGYAATKATSARSSPDLNTVKGEVSIASPVTYDTEDEPAQIAAMLHKVNWTDAEGEIEWEIIDKHLDLVPSDCVGLSLRGRVTRARVTNIEDSPGIRKLTMRVDRQSAYTSDVTGIPLPTPTPPQPSILSPTINAYMDIPALLDSHDLPSPVYYDGMTGQTEVWPGAVLQRSLDGGSTWTNVTATTLNAIMGVLQEEVPAAMPYYTDTTSRVVVQLYMEDEIESISNTAFLSERGAFALSWEDSGVRHWEIMQYRDAEQDSSGNWVLTTLHRGRLNTEAATHPAGSVFVLLDSAIRMVPAQTAWIGGELTHRAVTNGMSPETAAASTRPFDGNSQREWPVAHLFLEQDSAGDTTATAVPRHRFGTSLNPVRSINWDGYRWTVTDGSNTITRDGTSEVETFETSGWSTPITVTVSQLNRLTGAGPSVSEVIP